MEERRIRPGRKAATGKSRAIMRVGAISAGTIVIGFSGVGTGSAATASCDACEDPLTAVSSTLCSAGSMADRNLRGLAENITAAGTAVTDDGPLATDGRTADRRDDTEKSIACDDDPAEPGDQPDRPGEPAEDPTGGTDGGSDAGSRPRTPKPAKPVRLEPVKADLGSAVKLGGAPPSVSVPGGTRPPSLSSPKVRLPKVNAAPNGSRPVENASAADSGDDTTRLIAVAAVALALGGVGGSRLAALRARRRRTPDEA